jgi:hypothetical protein
MADEKSPEQDNTILRHIEDELAGRPDSRTDEEINRIEDLEDWRDFDELSSIAGGELQEVPTTLGRIPRETATALIARGYLNAVAGAYVFGVVDSEAARLSVSLMTRERLDRLTS